MAGFAGEGICVHIADDRLLSLYPPAPTTVRGATTHLGTHPKGEPLLLYPSNRCVVVRRLGPKAAADAARPGLPTGHFVYRGHNAAVTVAKWSPSGCYVASGDASGKVRVWAYDHEEKLLRKEVQALAGPIKDLAWDRCVFFVRAPVWRSLPLHRAVAAAADCPLTPPRFFPTARASASWWSATRAGRRRRRCSWPRRATRSATWSGTSRR